MGRLLHPGQPDWLSHAGGQADAMADALCPGCCPEAQASLCKVEEGCLQRLYGHGAARPASCIVASGSVPCHQKTGLLSLRGPKTSSVLLPAAGALLVLLSSLSDGAAEVCCRTHMESYVLCCFHGSGWLSDTCRSMRINPHLGPMLYNLCMTGQLLRMCLPAVH